MADHATFVALCLLAEERKLTVGITTGSVVHNVKDARYRKLDGIELRTLGAKRLVHTARLNGGNLWAAADRATEYLKR